MKNNVLTEEVANAYIADEKLSTKDYTSITPEAARVLAQSFKSHLRPTSRGDSVTQSKLDLSGLVTLDASSARALSKWGQNHGAFIMELNLSGLPHLTPETAAAIAAWQPAQESIDGSCSLILDGITEITPEILEILCNWKPACMFQVLSLNGLNKLDAEQAKALKKCVGGDFAQLLLSGVISTDVSALEQLVQWPGELLALGIESLTPEMAAVLSKFDGQTLVLDKLKDIDITTAQNLFNTDVGEMLSPSWECLVLGDHHHLLNGITQEVADWITDMRAGGINVQLSKLSELSVYANCTFVEKQPEPKSTSLTIGGRHGIFFSEYVRCPFCFALVGEMGDMEHETSWPQQWTITPCAHLISVVANNDSLLKIAGIEEERMTAKGRIIIRVAGYFSKYVNADPEIDPEKDEIVFEFAPV
jgi:hypothetical protein